MEGGGRNYVRRKVGETAKRIVMVASVVPACGHGDRNEETLGGEEAAMDRSHTENVLGKIKTGAWET